MVATLDPRVGARSGPARVIPLVARDAALAVSPGNAATVRSMYAAFSRLAHNGEIASYVAEYFDPDCEYRAGGGNGRDFWADPLIRWNQRWLEAWADNWDEVDRTIENGEMVVAAIRVHGRGRKSEMEISQRLFDVFELRDGKIVRMKEYLDPHQALEAAGLSE